MKANDAAVVHGSEFPDWRTDRQLYAMLDREIRWCGFFNPEEFDDDLLGIATDLAADQDNHLAPFWCGPGSNLGHTDALSADWHRLPQPSFLNPPYSRELNMPIDPWIEKLRDESRKGGYYFALTPHRPDTKWFRLLNEAAEIREIPHRVKFSLPPEAFAARNARRVAAGKKPLKATSGAGFPSVVSVWHPQPGLKPPSLPRRVTWDYLERRPHG